MRNPILSYELFLPYFYIVGSIFIFILLLIIIKKTYYSLLNGKKYKYQNQWLNQRDLLVQLKSLTPKEFENYISRIYSELGYNTQVVGGSYDGGIDIIATKQDKKLLIQCKKFIRRKVTVHDVRDFYGSMADKLSNAKGIFITTNIFTTEAEKFAENKPIELIDGFGLIKLIKLTQKNSVNNEIYKSCPNCNAPLVDKVGKYGKFLGCSNYPRCKFTKSITT